VTTPNTSSNPPQTRGGGNGRVAMRELGELLLLRERPVLVGVAAVAVPALVVTLIAPALVASTFVVGAIVGILGLGAGLVMALVVDGSDPVLRGPRHLRRGGVPVLGWLRTATVPGDSDVLDTVARRVEATGRTRLVLVDADGDGGGALQSIGRSLTEEAAGRGITSLLIDLRDLGGPSGIADVHAGRLKLGEAAVIAKGRPCAVIGAGGAPQAAAEAAIALIERPPSDLQLMVVVAAVEPEGGGGLHAAADRVVLVTAADASLRADVQALSDELRADGATVEALVVGGRQIDRGARAAVEAHAAVASTDPAPAANAPAAAVEADAVDVPAPGNLDDVNLDAVDEDVIDEDADVEEASSTPSIAETPSPDGLQQTITPLDASASPSPIAPFSAEAEVVAVPPAAPPASDEKIDLVSAFMTATAAATTDPADSETIGTEAVVEPFAPRDTASSSPSQSATADITASTKAEPASLGIDAPSPDDDLQATAALHLLAQDLSDGA
jgi:hypothetical protein